MRILNRDVTLIRLISDLLNELIFHPFLAFFAVITLPLMKADHKTNKYKRILLVCDSSMMAEYLAEVPEIFSGDDRVKFFLLDYFHHDRKDGPEMIYNLLPFQRISLLRAFLIRWDLVITSAVRNRHLVNNVRYPTLWIKHGPEAGRRVLSRVRHRVGNARKDSDFYAFSKSVYRNKRNGKMRFTKIFSTSDWNYQTAIKVDSQFKDVIRVVGFMHDDKMLELVPKREQIRKDLGLTEIDKAIFVLSTWGPYSLYNTMGDIFLREAKKLTDQFRFILNVHPKEYRPKPQGARVWGEYLRTQKQFGFLIREQSEDWTRYMVACDAIITDFTSLSLHGVLLNKPIVFVPFPEEAIDHSSLINSLKEFSPILKPDASDLCEKINWALERYPFDKLNKLANDINSRPGKSREIMRKEICELLFLDSKI